jgi:hypothetical protein
MKPGSMATFGVLGWVATSIAGALLLLLLFVIVDRDGWENVELILALLLLLAGTSGLALATHQISARRSRTWRALYPVLAIVLLGAVFLAFSFAGGRYEMIFLVGGALLMGVLIAAMVCAFQASSNQWLMTPPFGGAYGNPYHAYPPAGHGQHTHFPPTAPHHGYPPAPPPHQPVPYRGPEHHTQGYPPPTA